MSLFRRFVAIAALAAAATAMFAGSASATITFPYSTSAGFGTIDTISPLGNGFCNLSGIRANATSTTSSTVTGFTATGCRGTLTSATFLPSDPIVLTYTLRPGSPGTITVRFAFLVGNVFGGLCLDRATLTGTANGTNTKVMTGTATLIAELPPSSRRCRPTLAMRLTKTYPGAIIR